MRKTIAPMMREPTARTPRAETRDWSFFMGLKGSDNRSADGMVRQSTAEVNKKVLGTFAGGFQGAKGGDDGEGYREGEKWAKA